MLFFIMQILNSITHIFHITYVFSLKSSPLRNHPYMKFASSKKFTPSTIMWHWSFAITTSSSIIINTCKAKKPKNHC
jgi:hypothetical protein